MKLTLSDNIRTLRKERRLTQEQLAEALGVTTGAVHKWEAGLSIPELDMIIKIADLFDASVDSLLGYRVKDDRCEAIIERLSAYCRTVDPEAIPEAEKALLKYPNDFKIVHTCAQIFLVYGLGQHDRALSRRGLELMEKSQLLLSQNKDPEISEHTINKEISTAYYSLGETEKCLDIMKKNNIGGLFSDEIGCMLAFLKRPKEARPFLSGGILSCIYSLMNVVSGYAMVFFEEKDYGSAESILLWGQDILRGIRHEEKPGIVDKMHSELLVLIAEAQLKRGEKDKAADTLDRAAELAMRFDSAPDFGHDAIKYVFDVGDGSSHDSMGATAMEGIDTLLGFVGDTEITALWKSVAGKEKEV